MAAKRRSRRTTRSVKKRSVKKRVSSAAATVRAVRKSAATGASMVETALAAFAHEVRTPLTGILAISNLLSESVFQRLFHEEVMVEATERLLHERVPLTFEIQKEN